MEKTRIANPERSVQLPIFNLKDFHNQTIAVSAYKGILIGWDGDMDGRVFDMIDIIKEKNKLSDLVAIQEHEASLLLFWKNAVPEEFSEGKDFDIPDGDMFSVYSSVVVKWEYELKKEYVLIPS